MNKEPTIKVYFNSACPVCKAGIESQKGKMPECPVDWNDVHLDNELVRDLGAGLEFVRERLHVLDEEGQLQVGWDAFITIWRHSPGERWKARLGSLPAVRQLCSLAYNLFARALYRWNRHSHHW
jgi:predicted DCC family thiol-disulfide oxidoreductase YuxK